MHPVWPAQLMPGLVRVVSPAATKAVRRWAVCQLGARMHYAVPQILHEAGSLERLFTDVYLSSTCARLLLNLSQRLPLPALRRLSGRTSQAVPWRLVTSFPQFGLAYHTRCGRAIDHDELTDVFLWAGRQFGRQVVRRGFGAASAVYTFNTAALEILRAARELGLYTVVEQTIAPREVEEQLLSAEAARYPGWEAMPLGTATTAAVIEREREEWATAEMIVCGSDFVRESVARCGGPADRCVVVPYGVDNRFAPRELREHRGPLRVLTVGQVGIRKGAPRATEVAIALGGAAEFRWVGPVTLSSVAQAKMRAHIDLRGAVARSHMMEHYDWADVFFLPSVCEGSATVIYEALACGLPVVTTPNAGSVVVDGITGYVVATHDATAMACRLRELHRDRSLLARLATGVAQSRHHVSLASYRDRLLRALTFPSDE